jgi:hypothetical protein
LQAEVPQVLLTIDFALDALPPLLLTAVLAEEDPLDFLFLLFGSSESD